MTDLDEIQADEPADGRVARRERNINAVIDVVLEMFAEDAMFPTIEQAAQRSGLSLRSLYRYFADPGELLEAAVVRSRELAEPWGRLHAIGQGPLETRIDDFVAMRLGLYDVTGAVHRASIANAARHARVSHELRGTRTELGKQFERQFAPELGALDKADAEAALAAGDLATQLHSIDFLRRHRKLSAARTAAVLKSTLHALLG